jgi:two-component system sensor histidine kinase KdpD
MPGRLHEYLEVLAATALVTLGGWFLPLNYHAFGEIYLLAVIALSVRVGPAPAFFAAIVSSAAWDFFLVPPRLAFATPSLDESLLIGIYFGVAVIGGQLASLRLLRERTKLLAASERLHQALFDSVSHELKTPLAVLRSAFDHLGTEDPARRERLISVGGTALHRLDHLVENLLNQTRLESGALRPKMSWCDPQDIVASAQRALEERMEGRPVKINIPPGLPLFFADVALMEQVIGNLLLNAAVHTPPSGEIRVSAGLETASARVFIRVADQGPGIPEELKERIFDKFQRGPAARPGGLGLGLAVARNFMLAQGGEIAVSSSPGQGACFTAFLPLQACGEVPLS